MVTDTSNKHGFEPVMYFHPGEYLSEKIDEMGLTIKDFAKLSGLTREQVEGIVSCKMSVTEPIAKRLYVATNIPVYWWLRDQEKYDEYIQCQCPQEVIRMVKPTISPIPVGVYA